MRHSMSVKIQVPQPVYSFCLITFPRMFSVVQFRPSQSLPELKLGLSVWYDIFDDVQVGIIENGHEWTLQDVQWQDCCSAIEEMVG